MDTPLPPGGLPPMNGPPSSAAPPPGFGGFPPMDPAIWATLDHSRNTGPAIGVAAFCIIITTAAVALRLYTRCFLLKRVGADDYMALASLAGVLAVAGAMIHHTKHGLGSHIWDVALDPTGLVEFFHHFYLGVVFYNITLLFIKLSLILQYYPIIRQIPRYRVVFFAVAGFVIAWTIAMMFTVILICVPARGYWDKTVPAKCLPDQPTQLANAIGNIVTDVMLLVLPLPMVWRLRLATRQKVVLTGLFCLGFFAVVISLLRASFLFSPHMDLDITRDAVAISGWTLAEITTGTLCAALITLRPLVSRVLPEFGTIRSALRAITPGVSQKLNEYALTDPSTAKGRGGKYASNSVAAAASPGPVSPGPRPSPRPFYSTEAEFTNTQSLVLVIQGHSQVSLEERQPSSGGETDPALSSYEDLAHYSREREGLHFDANALAGLEPAAPIKPGASSAVSSLASRSPSPSPASAAPTELRYPPRYHGQEPSN